MVFQILFPVILVLITAEPMDEQDDLPPLPLTLDVYKNAITVIVNSNFTSPLVENYKYIVKHSEDILLRVPNLNKTLVDLVS